MQALHDKLSAAMTAVMTEVTPREGDDYKDRIAALSDALEDRIRDDVALSEFAGKVGALDGDACPKSTWRVWDSAPNF